MHLATSASLPKMVASWQVAPWRRNSFIASLLPFQKARVNDATYRTESRRLLAASLAQLGQLEEAREEAKLYLARNPHFRISHWLETQPYRDLALRDRELEGLRKAGFPE